MSIVYAILKDPFVCYKTVSVLKSTKDNEASCATCSKAVYHEPLNLFARKLIGLFCSFDCLGKYDGGYLGKGVRVPTQALTPVPDAPEKEDEVDWGGETDVAEPIKKPTEPVKAKKVTAGAKKTCPKCGGAAKRGRGAGTFYHDEKCPGI